VIAIYAFVAIFAQLIAPFGEAEVFPSADLPWAMHGGDEKHVFGTDQIGRDVLSRLIYGAQNTIGIALVTTLLSFLIGGALGLVAAINRSWLDQLLSRGVDVLMSIPSLIFALMLLSIFGSTIPSLILIIAVLDSTRVFRLTRSVAINAVVMDYVEAAKLRGENLGWLGIQPPTADWGSMVRDGSRFIQFAAYDWTVALPSLLPASAVALLTVAVNFVVDWFLHKTSGLRDE